MELVPGVHRIEAEVGGRPLYLFAFLGERRLLLDAGCASTVDEFIVPFLEGLGLGLRDLDVLVVTHSDLDHQGGAHLLKRANPSLWVTCGVLDIPLISDPEALIARRYQAYAELHGIAPDDAALAWMRRESGGPVRVDVGWSGGELLELGSDLTVRILHVPGHSVGHIAVYDERSGALFGGDCLQGSVYLGLDGTRKLCPTYTHVDDYLATASQVESQTCLAEPRTLDALIACVNRQLDPPWPDDIAPELVYSVHGHAERLVALGTARRTRGEDGRVVYERAK